MAGSIKPSGNVVISRTITNQSNTLVINNSLQDSWQSMSIINGGSNDLEFVINGLTFLVKTNEEFTNDFDFNSISISPSTDGQSIDYRILIKI